MNTAEDLERIVDEYTEFEHRVRELMIAQAAPCCSVCPSCCCRFDICEETIDSAFLSLIRTREEPGESFSDSYGWLTPTGCLLKIGRPPVCYEFLCDDIMHSMPDDDARFALRTLGMLITYVGRKAIGTRHLVELLNPDDLLRLRYERFHARLATAQTALEDIEEYFSSGAFPDEAMPHLLKICKPGTDMYQGP